MRHAILCAAALLAGCAAEAPEQTPGANPLVGTWELVEYSDTPRGGAPIHVFGNPPVGQFVFTADGHASINITRNPPGEGGDAVVDPDPAACLPAWYCSYFGTYIYDPAGSAWTTHVAGGNIPSYIGTDQRRAFAIDGDQLIISETYEAEGTTYHAERVLRRAKAGGLANE